MPVGSQARTSWISAFKSGWLGGVRTTLDLDILNAFNSASTLRQFTDAITTCRSPLEIVRRVYSGSAQVE